SSPPTRIGHAVAYDEAHGYALVFGGVNGTTRYNDTWAFRYDGPAEREGCVYGLDGDGDKAIGCADPDCFGICTPSCTSTVMATWDPTWPECGDGVCSGDETPRICSADCGAAAASCGNFVCEPPETAVTCPGDCS